MAKTKMNKAIDIEAVRTWVEALESGNYSQTRETLVSTKGDSFCCLGVQCKLEGFKTEGYRHNAGEKAQYRVFVVGYNQYDNYPPEATLNKYGLSRAGREGFLTASTYAELNDDGVYDEKTGLTKRVNFKGIAARLREDYTTIGVVL